MIGYLRVTDSGFTVVSGAIRPGASLDILLDGRRIWTCRAAGAPGVARVEWPRGLRRVLRGTGEFAVRRTGDVSVVASRVATIAGDPVPIDLTDDEGHPLVVNKWGELVAQFAGRDRADIASVLALTRRLVDLLRADGTAVMITSGTLLGWVRARDVLAHDDDTDLAVVLPDVSSPADVGIEGFRLRRLIAAAGLEVTLHSAAHIQVRDPRSDAYCDIFLGFFRDGVYHQPFHLRAPVDRGALLPPVQVTLAGVDLPAPPDPGQWLAACYGPDWETPDPGFRFDTPRSTRDRYESWFGTFDFGRAHWDRRWSDPDRPVAPDAGVAHVRAVRTACAEPGTVLIDAGCGDGTHTARMGTQAPALAFDFSSDALAAATSRLGDGASVLPANFADLADLARVVSATRGRTPVLSLLDVLHVLPGPTRENALHLARWACRAGGRVIATFPVELDRERFEFEDPGSWHLPIEVLAPEAARMGMRIRELARFQADGRDAATVELVLTHEEGALP